MPQIELMQADLPHTLYDYKGKPDKECERLNREALEKARARRAKKTAGATADRAYTLDEVFSGAADE